MTGQVKRCQDIWHLQVNLFPFLVNLPVSKMSYAYDFFFFLRYMATVSLTHHLESFLTTRLNFLMLASHLLVHKHSGFALYHHFHSTLLFFSSLEIRPVCYLSVFFLSFNHLIIHDCSPNWRTSLSPDWWRTVLTIHISCPGLPRACFLICEKLWI